MSNPSRLIGVVAGLLVALLVFVPAVSAQDPSFVGKLAVAVDPEVAKQLGISDETRTKLLDIVNKREQEVVNLVAGLSGAERDAKLAAFVTESEQQGLSLLSEEQRAKLEQVSIARAGMAGLADARLADQLGLRADQKQKIDGLVKEYNEQLTKGTDTQKQAARSYYEKAIAKLLSDEQRSAWEKLSGVPAGGPPPAVATSGPSGGPAIGGAPGATVQRAPGSPDQLVVSPEGKVRFNFKFAPWKDVIDFFALNLDLALVGDTYPEGTFNYTDSKYYTPEEAMDLINRVLATKGFMLVRHERLLMVWDLEDGAINPVFVPHVDPKVLDTKGDFEIVTVQFQLSRYDPAEAEADANKLKGPTGSVVLLTKPKQLVVTDAANKVRAIQAMIEAVEGGGLAGDRVAAVKLNHILPTEFLTMARQLLGIEEGEYATPDGSVRISVNELDKRVYITGKAVEVERVEAIVKVIDIPPEASDSPTGVIEQPQFEVYPITLADPLTVQQVTATLLSGMPDMRITSDPKSGSLYVWARPSQHASIKAILDQMQHSSTPVEVFKLRKMDPTTAMLAINKLFGALNERDPAAASAPRVDADPINMQLMVRGTPSQLAQIRELLIKLGEIVEPGQEGQIARSNYRIIPLSGRGAQRALEQLGNVWPSVAPNRVRIVTPSASRIEMQSLSRSGEQPAASSEMRFTPADIERLRQALPPRTAPPGSAPAPQPAPRAEEADTTRVLPSRMTTYFVSKPDPIEPEDGLSIAVPVRRPRPATALTNGQGSPPAAPANDQVPLPQAELDAPGVTPTTGRGFEQSEPPAGESAPRRTFSRQIPLPGGATPPAASQPATDQPPADASSTDQPTTDQPAADQAGSEQEPEIIVQVTPNGIIISSEDLDALDAFERLLSEFSTTAQGGKEFTVFSLRHARAETAAVLLQAMLTGGVGTSDEFGGGNLMGDLAANMLGGSGGIMGALLGGGGASGDGVGPVTAGTATITPDPRLNLLYVSASYRELDTIERYLEVIDQPENPDALQMQKPPRFIPIENGVAQDIANIVKQVYANRIAADSSQQRQTSPEDLFRSMLRGGRDRRGGGGQQQSLGEEQKMTIGVDPASNSLIVAAPDYLFNEVREFVMAIDTAAVRPDETTRVVQIKRASSALMQQSLKSRLGPSATINIVGATTTGTTTSTTPTTTTSSTSSQTSSTSGDRSRSSDDAERTRRQMEFFNQLQQSRGGDRGGGDRGSTFRTFGGFPGGGFPSSSGFSRGGFGGDSGRGSFGGFDRGGSDRGRGSDSGRGGDSRRGR